MEEVEQLSVEQATDEIEKKMQGLPPERTEHERRMYIAGVIDTMEEYGVISSDARNTLYPIYAY